MASLFESYERRIDKINAVLAQYGINGVEDAKAICAEKGLDPYKTCEETQPICFENAKWAYVVGAAIAIKKGVKTAAEAAEAMEGLPFRYDPLSRVGIAGTLPEPDGHGTILIATGGTSDQPVAEEAALTAEALGNRVVRLYDVGVAGLHRLLAHLDEIMSAQVIVAIAGMEGALASVIGGLADCPVIAVPTSVGYGASLGGLSALLSMLNSCASGVSVVNIDNGFGAGYLANMINHMEVKG